MQIEVARKGGWLSGEEGDSRNKQRAHLFSALAGAVGSGNREEVFGRMKKLSYGVRVERHPRSLAWSRKWGRRKTSQSLAEADLL